MGSVDILAGCLHFSFLMHPSSFYDLRARYVYTPLYGPYSLSEALEGLIFYSLNESRDFILIGSKRSLRHELVSELSNVVHDLQDYLIYFSSKFLISPSNSTYFIEELRGRHEGIKCVSSCWGAIITRLAVARKIVEGYLWPHLFLPAINNLEALQRLKRPPSSTLPDVQRGKSSIPVSRFILPPRWDSIPSSANPLSGAQRLPFDVRSERPRTRPSKTDLTIGDEDRALFSRFDATPSPSELHQTRIPSNDHTLVVPLKSHSSLTYEDRSDEDYPPPNHPSATRCFYSSTPTRASSTRDSGNSKVDAKVGEVDEQDMGEKDVAAEGEGVTMVPCTLSPPVQLTCVPGSAAKALVTTPASTSSSTIASWPTSTTPYTLNSTANLDQGPTFPLPRSIPLPHSFADAIAQPSTCSSSLTTSRYTSATPYTFISTTDLHLGPTMPLSRPIPLPHSFANPISGRSTRFPPNRRHPQHSSSRTRKRPLEVPSQRFKSSTVHLPTTPFHCLSTTRKRSRSSTPVPTCETREPGDGKDIAKAVGIEEQVNRKTGVAGQGEEVTEVLSACSHPVQLSPIQNNDAGEPKPMLSPKATSPSVALWPISTTRASATTSPPPTALQPSSITQASAEAPSPSTASSFTLSTPHNSNFHLMSAIPLLHSFVKTSSRPPAHLSLKTQHSQLPIPSVPIRSLSATQKRRSKTQTRHFGPSSVRSPITPPFQYQSPPPGRPSPTPTSKPSPLNVQSECPHSASPETDPTGGKEARASFLRLDTTPTPFVSCPPGIPLNSQPSNITLEPCFPQLDENCLIEVFVLPNCTNAARHSSNSTPTSTSNMGEFMDLKNEVKMVEIDRRVSRDTEVAGEGEDDTEVPGARSYPVSLIPIQAGGAVEHIAAVPARTSSPATASQSNSIAPYISNSTPSPFRGSFPRSCPNSFSPFSTRLSSKKQRTQRSVLATPFYPPSTTRTLSPSTALRPSPTALHVASRAPYISNSPTDLHYGSRFPLPSSHQPPNITFQPRFPQTHENCSDEVVLSRNRIIAVQRSDSSTSAYTRDAMEPGNLKDNAEVGGANGQDTKEIEVVAEGEEVTQDIEELVAAPAKTLSSSTALRPSTTALQPSLTTLRHMSIIRAQSSPTSSATSSNDLSIDKSSSVRSPTSSITTSPLQRQPLKTCPLFPPYRDERLLRGDPTSPIAVDNAGNTSLSGYSTPPISPSALASNLSSPILDNTLNTSHHQPPSPVIFDNVSDMLSSSHDDPSIPMISPSASSCSSTSTHTHDVGQGLLAQGQLGNLEGNEKDMGPNELAQLMLEYSSMEGSIMSILSLGELTVNLIIDRGEGIKRGLRRYHLATATMDHIYIVAMAQQTLVQRAAALMVEGKSQFIVDPKDTLIPILQGTNSLPQLYVAWKALMARMRLGVKTWGKYVAEYQLQVGAHC